MRSSLWLWYGGQYLYFIMKLVNLVYTDIGWYFLANDQAECSKD